MSRPHLHHPADAAPLREHHAERRPAPRRADLDHFPPIRIAALRRLLGVNATAYARTRNHLDGAVTGLSPYFTHGFVTEAEAFAAWRRFGVTLAQKLGMELAWRCFFAHVRGWAGNAIFANLRPGLRHDYAPALPVDLLEARTGVPVIDASVRRLYATGYLRNHARMWLASYVVHLRKIHWRAGADWLYGHHIDGDAASNHLSWQWVAGTFSAKPYLFNADNVAKYAPTLASPGTTIDADYAALNNHARLGGDAGPEPGVHPGVAHPPLFAAPPGHINTPLPPLAGPARREQPPGGEHRYAKHRVGGDEDPLRRFVVQQSLQPEFDEAAAIRAGAGPHPQPHLQRRQRADGADPGLGDNDANGGQMRHAKPEAVHPAPAEPVARQHGHEAAHHEGDDRDVQREDGVGEDLVWHWRLSPATGTGNDAPIVSPRPAARSPSADNRRAASACRNGAGLALLLFEPA